MSQIEISKGMQTYLTFNIDICQRTLDNPKSSLMEKFSAECSIKTFKHVQQKLDSLRYQNLKGVEKSDIPSNGKTP